MTTKDYDKKKEYRINLIEKCESVGQNHRELLTQIVKLCYYDGEIPTNTWNCSGATGFLTKEQLLNSEDYSNALNTPIFTKFFKDAKKSTTHFVTLRFLDWEKANTFLRDFDIRPEQITFASWIYNSKSVFITFYTDAENTPTWFRKLRNTFYKINCGFINQYGEVGTIEEVIFPSCLSDRHLNPETLKITDDLIMVAEHAKNSISHPVSVESFVKKISEKRIEGENYLSQKTKYAQSLTERDKIYISNVASTRCTDPRCLYSSVKEPRTEWKEGVYNIISEIYALILHEKSIHAEQNEQSFSIQMSLQDFYCYRCLCDFFSCLNTQKLRDVILKALISEKIISFWLQTTESMVIKYETDDVF